ncbi:MAG: nicotinate (nicotinamide) nucleotide adenylyltransferase [Burkholderiales bacterium]|nr:nicotinate (nicotinamide) nucleotide adenylyltransferase [Phycisphaerae bacterium]
MNALCFGGSFNPVHNAHLQCSIIAARQAGFNRVVLIPTGQPALKDDDYQIASAADRVAMLRLATKSVTDPQTAVEIDTLEIDRAGGPSYTIDTVRALRDRGWLSVNWLIGADQLLSLHRWHRFEELLTSAQMWVMARPGYLIDWGNVHPAARALEARVLQVPQMDISATDIRRRVREGLPIIGLVPDDVREYILKRRLYIP